MIAKGSEKIEKGYKLAEKEEMSGDESDLEDDDVDEGATGAEDDRRREFGTADIRSCGATAI